MSEEPATEPANSPATGDGPLGALPVPDRDGVPRPDGEPGGLEVLDWAGFDAAITYTFDDGQPSHLEHYPALQATDRRMTFYLSSNLSFEGFETGWQRVAADGHELGNHTASHSSADGTESAFGEPLDSPAAELAACSTFITETFPRDAVWTMAAPYGDPGWRDPARAAGLIANRGVGDGPVLPGEETDPFDLPSYVAAAGDTAATFTALIDAARDRGAWQIFTFHTITPAEEVWYAPVDIEAITASVEHATAAGDCWIDTLAAIGVYWRGQRIVERAERTDSEDAITWSWSLPSGFPSGQPVRVTVDGGMLSQHGTELAWDPHGYYAVSLDTESLTLSV